MKLTVKNEKPVVLWSVYFNMARGVSADTDHLPCNVRLTSLPSAQMDFEDALQEVVIDSVGVCWD